MESAKEENTLKKNYCSSDSVLSTEDDAYLKSLGFTVNNGKPRFRLGENEPTTSDVKDFSIINPDDGDSFVVLGTDRWASSLASYIDKKQSSTSIDYNSMIESLDSSEINQKLNELLQENDRLRNTLKENNTAMKQHFNTLASWQEEILKVHRNHKVKFAETKEFISYLQKENTELKIKLAAQMTDNTEMGYKTVFTKETKDQSAGTDESIEVTKVQQKDETASNHSGESVSGTLCNSNNQMTPSSWENIIKSMEKFSFKDTDTLKDVLNKSIDDYKKIFRHATDSFYSENLNNRHWQQELSREIQDSNAALEKVTNSLNEQMLASIMMKHSSDMLPSFDMLSSTNTTDKSISDYRKLHLVKTELQKIRQDYSSFLEKLGEVTQKSTGSTENIFPCEAVQEAACSPKRVTEKEEEKSQIEQERDNIELQKKTLSCQKEYLEIEYKNLRAEKELVEQEKISLREEKASLDQQSELYEDQKKFLENENKLLRREYNEMLAMSKSLQENLQIKEKAIKDLDLNLHELKIEMEQLVEKNVMLETQATLWAEDFRQERKVKVILLEEKNKLDTDLQEQLNLNKTLHEQLLKNSGESIQFPEVKTYQCPKCLITFMCLSLLEAHVNHCISSD